MAIDYNLYLKAKNISKLRTGEAKQDKIKLLWDEIKLSNELKKTINQLYKIDLIEYLTMNAGNEFKITDLIEAKRAELKVDRDKLKDENKEIRKAKIIKSKAEKPKQKENKLMKIS